MATSSSDHIKREVLVVLGEWKDNEFINMAKERNSERNQPYAFQSVGGVGEEIALALYLEFIGSGSKGGCAHDLRKVDDEFNTIEAKEVKMVSLDGSKECTHCEKKAPRFQERCVNCKNDSFKYYADSRAGISAKAHINYKDILNEYIIIVCKYNDDKQCINIKAWKILSDNEYFNDYIYNQHKNGKKDTCNCLPGSMDFHLSGPIKLFEFNLYKDMIEETFFDINNDKYEPIPKCNFNTGRNLKYVYLDDSCEIFNDNDSIPYVENIKYFKKKSEKKTGHGKERGEVVRK